MDAEGYAQAQQANMRIPQTYGMVGQASQSVGAPRRQRRLDDIAAAADTTARIAERLDGMISRFQAGPPAGGSDNSANPLAVSYSNQLDRLQDNIGRISKALDVLEEFV